jgi:hypothetical protein
LVECIFPFKYQDILFNECTTLNDPDGKFWCSTKVDESGNHVVGQGEWGYCDPDCETEKPETSIKFRLVEQNNYFQIFAVSHTMQIGKIECTVKPVYNGHPWDPKKAAVVQSLWHSWSLFTVYYYKILENRGSSWPL